MHTLLVIKAGFLGFALSIGVLMLTFFVVGGFIQVSQANFRKVFLLAAIISFLVIDLFLYYKIVLSGNAHPFFLAGCVGGWLGGIFSGLTHMKRFLMGFRWR